MIKPKRSNYNPRQNNSNSHLPGRIGRYEILELLGRGGMGAVYRAFDPSLGREVVVKLISVLAIAADDEWRRRFQREVQTAGQLRHSNIVTVYDVDLNHEPPYVVMELLTGGTLKDLLQQRSLPWREALVLLRPLVQALAYAHRQKVIHRDLKPANVMFAGDEGNTLKLVDFGLARGQDEDQMTRTGIVMGTPTYMAPEQARAI
jgi:serine/threonine-protein kinase